MTAKLTPSEFANLDPYTRAVYLVTGELLTDAQRTAAENTGLPPAVIARAIQPTINLDKFATAVKRARRSMAIFATHMHLNRQWRNHPQRRR